MTTTATIAAEILELLSWVAGLTIRPTHDGRFATSSRSER